MSHFTYEGRKTINSMLTNDHKCMAIVRKLNKSITIFLVMGALALITR